MYLNYGRFHREVSRKHVVFISCRVWIYGLVVVFFLEIQIVVQISFAQLNSSTPITLLLGAGMGVVSPTQAELLPILC